ncbi:MAG TPA: ATP-binding protein, partial [Gaiellaceae bacterium]
MSDNPFRYGALALDEAFTDREEEIRELTADIRNGQDVVVFGPRRYGKTSLVWRVSRDLIARGLLVAHVDLMTAPTKQLLAEKLARTIHADIASRVERARERALQVFRGLRVQPRITIDPDDGSVSFAFDTARTPADVDATLERLLELPGELGAERKRKVALVLDEFQEITELDPHLPKLLRAVFQTQPEVAHVYLGSKRHLLQRIFNDANEPFWRSAKQMELGLIPVPRFREFLRARFAATGKRVDDAVLDPMLELTHGHPYATQELAYFVWEQAGSR